MVLSRDGDFLYLETVLSAQQRASGDFVSAELTKESDGTYHGFTHTGRTCWVQDPQARALKSKQCSSDYSILVFVLSPTGIEGIAEAPPDGAALDCGKCTYSSPRIWVSFAFIPK